MVPKMRLGATAPAAASRGRVGLFLGCVAREFDRETLAAARDLLVHFGWEVVIPQQPGCCGAMYSHLGGSSQGLELAERSAAALDIHDLDSVVYTSSGCGLHVQGHADSTVAWVEIGVFLARHHGAELAAAPACSTSALLHTPCTLRYGLGAADAAKGLLSHQPGLNLIELPEGCCGAGGLHQLRFPDQARAMRSRVLDGIDIDGVDCLLTSNVGCALHFEQAPELVRSVGRVRVLHPVTWLAEAFTAARSQ